MMMKEAPEKQTTPSGQREDVMKSTKGSRARYEARAKQVRARLNGLARAYPSIDFKSAFKSLHNADVVLEHFNPTLRGDHDLVVFNLSRAEELGEAAPIAAKLPALLEKFEHERTPKQLKPKRSTGHFVGAATLALMDHETALRKIGGHNVIRHITPEMIAALKTQRRLAGLELPKRGVAVHIVNGHKKRAGKKG